MAETTRPSDVFGLFFGPKEVTEIRAYGLRGRNKGWEGSAWDIVSGYFNDPQAFQDAARVLEAAKAPGIYFVLNPVAPDLLARANNRLIAAGQKTKTTSDHNVAVLRWLYIDIDPVRPAGISASDSELALAIELRDKIQKHLVEERGLPERSTVRALSGNGAHLLVRLADLPPDDNNKQFLRLLLQSLDTRFSTDQVEVDVKTYNPARICKLYGTTARKGDNMPERPHRRSRIEGVGYG